MTLKTQKFRKDTMLTYSECIHFARSSPWQNSPSFRSVPSCKRSFQRPSQHPVSIMRYITVFTELFINMDHNLVLIFHLIPKNTIKSEPNQFNQSEILTWASSFRRLDFSCKGSRTVFIFSLKSISIIVNAISCSTSSRSRCNVSSFILSSWMMTKV